MINQHSIRFNVVSKKLGSDVLVFYLTEAAGDIRDMLESEMEDPKARL
jgi:carnitine O-acetyltransferase